MSVDSDAAEAGRRELEVGPDGVEVRLDVFVAAALELSRTRVHKLIEDGRVLLDGRLARKSESLSEGQHLQVDVPEPTPLSLAPEEIPLDIVYQDEVLLVVDKPAGMVVHPSVGHAGGTLVNALLHHVPRDLSGIGGARRSGPASSIAWTRSWARRVTRPFLHSMELSAPPG